MSARITVRVTPRAGRDRIERWDGDILRVRIAAPPADGQANEALVRLLAKALSVPPSTVSVVSGGHARVKVVQIEPLTDAEVRTRLLTAAVGEW